MQATETRARRGVTPGRGAPDGRWPGLVQGGSAVAVAAVVVAGVVLRFVAQSDLWLDEALSVNIARLPVGDIGDALRHDGHPPLYYLLLHGWIELFGDGDRAVRSLSGVLSTATLPLAWVAGRRYAGRAGAITMVLLLTLSPFALRYATEARMYSLVMLLVLAGWLAVQRAWEQPSVVRLVPVALVSGLLLLTHYWSVYLLAATGVVLLWAAWRHANGRARRLLVALVLGALLFVPWLPGFLDQARNTGTPWGRPERPTVVLMVSLRDFGGVPPSAEGEMLGIGTALLALVGVFGRRNERRLELDVVPAAEGRGEATVLAGTVVLAVIAGYVTDSAFASRYMATVLPLLLLLAGLGATRVSPRVRVITLVVLLGLSAVGAARQATYDRTQGGTVAATINAEATGGDVVAFCPDQLGPATDRYLRDGLRTLTYPDGGAPERVDWVDYAERIGGADPAAFAAHLLDEAGRNTVWLVWKGGYRTYAEDCERLANLLASARSSVRIRVEARAEAFESMWLYEFPVRKGSEE